MSREDDDAGLPSLQRRSVLKSMAASGFVGGSTVSLADLAGASGAVEPGDLGTWQVVQNHETVDTTYSGSEAQASDKISHRNTISTVYGLSHVNTKVPDPEGDVLRSECGGSPGVQHRFVATTFSFGQRVHEWDPDDRVPVDGDRGIEVLDETGLEVTAPEDDSCGAVALSLNNAYQGRFELSELTDDSGTSASQLTKEAVDDDVESYFQSNSPDVVQDPAMPADEFPYREATKLGLSVVGIGLGIATGGTAGFLLGLGYSEWFVPSFLDTVYGDCQYRPSHELRDDRLVLKQSEVSCGSEDKGEAAFNFADFTITVPPNGGSTSFDVTQSVSYTPIGGLSDEPGTVQNGSDPNQHMRNEKAWTVEVPSIDTGRSLGSLGAGDLPSPSEADYDEAATPDPSIELEDLPDRTMTYRFSADTDVDADADDTSIRWRIYRDNTGAVRPTIGYGEQYRTTFLQGETDQDDNSAFGPGDYVAELTVFDEYGRIGADRVEFTVEDEIEEYPDARFTVPDGVDVEETVTLDGSSSVDVSEAPGNFPGEQINLYAWEIDPVEGESEWTYGRQTEYTFTEPGEYRVFLEVYTFDAETEPSYRSKVTEDGSPDSSAYSDKWVRDHFYDLRDSNSVYWDESHRSLSVNVGPSASLNVDTGDGETGDEVTFDASGSSDPDGELQSHLWTVTHRTGRSGRVPPSTPGVGNPPGAGETWRFEGETVTETFDRVGEYDVTLEVTDGDGATDSATGGFELDSGKNLDVWIGGDLGGEPDEDIILIARLDDDEHGRLSFEWSGAASGEGASTAVSFEEAGTYPVELDVYDDEGRYGHAETELSVSEAPTVDIEGPTEVDPNERVRYYADADDPDGEELGYSWSGARSGDGPDLWARFGGDQVVELTVTVTDPAGNTASDSIEVTVGEPQPPTVSIDAPSTAAAGEYVSFDAEANDPDGSVRSYVWDGDVLGSGQRVGKAFDDTGEYAATVEVTDDDGLTASATHSITIEENDAPTIQALNGPAEVQSGQRAAYSVEATDPENDELSFNWTGDVSGSGQSILTKFYDGGERTVRVVVSDVAGNSDAESMTVTVGANREPTIDSIDSPDEVNVGEFAEFTCEATDPDGDDLTYTWSGDVSGSGDFFSEDFASTGEKTVTCTVEDGNGGSDSQTVTVDVVDTNTPPTIEEITGPRSVDSGQFAPFSCVASDPDGDSLSYSWSGTVSGSGQEVSKTFYGDGERTVTCTVTDGKGGSDTQSITVTVGANDPPTIDSIDAPSEVEVGEYASFTCNASDPDGDSLTYAWSGDVSGSGDFLSEDFASTGTKSVTCTVEDGNGGSDSQTVSVDVVDTNTPPTIEEITGPRSIESGQFAPFSCVASDPDGDSLSYSWSGAVSGTGQEVSKTFYGDGDRTVTCTVTDGRGGSDSKTITVTITDNGAPTIDSIASPDEVEVGEYAQFTCNASDPDGDSLTYEWSGAVSGSGDFLSEDFGSTGTKSVTCTVSDGNGGSASRTVTVDVVDTNTPPTIEEITGPRSIDSGQFAAFSCEASDPDGDSLSYSWSGDLTGTGQSVNEKFYGDGERTVQCTVTDGKGGSDSRTITVTVDGNDPPTIDSIDAPSEVEVGEYAQFTCNASDPDGDSLNYSWSGALSGSGDFLSEDFGSTGEKTVTCTVEDGNGGSDSKTVTVDVVDTNTAPTIDRINGPRSVDSGQFASFTCEASDPDGDSLGYSWSGDLSGSGQSVNKKFYGDGDRTVTCTVADGKGGSDTKSITVSVSSNSPPSITSIDSPGEVEVGEYAQFTCNASDPDGDSLTYSWSGDVSGSGDFLSEDFASTGEKTVTCTVEDGNGGSDSKTVTVDVVDTNTPPTIDRINGPRSIDSGQFAAFSCEASDPDGDSLSYSWSGDLTGTGQSVNEKFYGDGERTVQCTVTDGKGGSDSRTITVTVSSNSPPTIDSIESPGEVEVGEYAQFTCNASDPDGDSLSYSWSGAVSGSGDFLSEDFGSTGTKSVTCTVSDGNGGSDSQTVSVDVVDTNNPPTIDRINGPRSIDSGQFASFSCEASDPDGDSLGYSWSGTVSGSGQEVSKTFYGDGDRTVKCTVTDGKGGSDSESITVTVDANDPPTIDSIDAPSEVEVGEYASFTCNASDPDGDSLDYSWSGDVSGSGDFLSDDFGSTGEKTVTCTVEDGNGGSDSQTVSVDVVDTNTPPTIDRINGPRSIDSGQFAAFSCEASDPDGDSLSYSWSGAVNGTGQSVNKTFYGDGDRTVKCTVTDGKGGSDSQSITVTVDANDPPTIDSIESPNEVEVGEYASFTCNASDPDGDSLDYSWSGDVSGSGDFLSEDFASTGTKSVTCTVTDGNGGSDSQTVSVDVVDTNNPPTIDRINGPRSIDSGQFAAFSCDASDPDGDSLSYSWSGDLTGTGQSVNEKFYGDGQRTVKCTVTDGKGGSDSESISVTVSSNSPPTIDSLDAPNEVDVGEYASFTCEASDPDGDSLDYSWSGDVSGSGSYESEQFSSTGTKIVTCTVDDGNGGSDSETAYVDVVDTNSPPNITSINAPSTVEPGQFVSVSCDASDPDGDSLSYSWSGAVSGNGPSTSDKFYGSGDRTVTCTVSDGKGGSDTASATISVEESNSPPNATGISGPDSVRSGNSASFSCSASDPDGDSLSYDWNVGGSGSSINHTFSGRGPVTVTCTVSDGNGGEDSVSKTVQVYDL